MTDQGPVERPGLALALYQPEIAGNAGAAVRLAAALDMPLHLIEPFGFVWDLRRLDRAALDYHRQAVVRRHRSFKEFVHWRYDHGRRVVLLSTSGTIAYTRFRFEPTDVLLAGQESAGVPEPVHAAVDVRLQIPMAAGIRSLNVVTALAMVAGEGLRQLGWQGDGGKRDDA